MGKRMRAAKIELFRFLSLLTMFCIVITGCASSAVQRDAAANVDMGVQNAKNLANSATDGNIADTYQNSSQTTKGLVFGGAAGAVVGSLTPAVGFIAGTAVGAVIGGSYGAYIDSNSSLEDRLQNRGVTIVELGDQILVVVPSYRIFDSMTADIKTSSYTTLNLLATYVNQFTKTLVKLSVYTEDTGSRSVDLGLSQQQANRLGKALQAYGIDTRLLYSAGYGGIHPVRHRSPYWEGNDNYRIEITLEKLYF
jgi:outer membrane protein OmpA-like peptidoglycan-associated protein